MVKNLPTSAGDSGSVPEAGYLGSIPEIPWSRKWHSIILSIIMALQYSYLEISMGRGAWRAAAHRVANSWIPLND